MNETIKNILERRSIRKYQERPVEETLLNEVVKAGTYAPSGMNQQSAIILVVTKKEIRDKLSNLNAKIMGTDTDPFYGAPAVIVVLADKHSPTHVYDGSLVMGNMMIAAHSLGLGTCWIHRAKEMFETEEGKEILKKVGITGEYEGIANGIIGYPAELGTLHDRKENYIYKIME